MATIRRAVIDVGTNSVKLLVADVAGREVRPVLEKSRQTRLGRDFYETHRLQPEPIARTVEAVEEFAKIARDQQAVSTRIIATSAARDAVNPRDLTRPIERACGLQTEIITGAREAEWVFQGVATDAELAKHPLLLLDVGGGSTEFILGHGVQKSFAQSFPLGIVRLMEKFPHSDPPTGGEFAAGRDWLKNFLRDQVRPPLVPALNNESAEIQLVGTGGTANILACMDLKLERFDRDRIEGARLSLARVRAHREHLWRLPLDERRKIPGLPPLRADVILTGVIIFEAVMEEFGFQQLRVSTRSLRFAAVMDPVADDAAQAAEAWEKSPAS